LGIDEESTTLSPSDRPTEAPKVEKPALAALSWREFIEISLFFLPKCLSYSEAPVEKKKIPEPFTLLDLQDSIRKKKYIPSVVKYVYTVYIIYWVYVFFLEFCMGSSYRYTYVRFGVSGFPDNIFGFVLSSESRRRSSSRDVSKDLARGTVAVPHREARKKQAIEIRVVRVFVACVCCVVCWVRFSVPMSSLAFHHWKSGARPHYYSQLPCTRRA
jgi:hypothetical protein